MDFTHAIAIFISSELASSVVHTLMTVAPGLQTSINVVLICINTCAWINGVFDQRLDGLLLHVREQMDHDLTATLHHPKDWWSFFLHRASPTLTFESASTALSLFALDHLRLSLMTGHHIGFIARSCWIPGSSAPTWSAHRNAFLTFLKKKGLTKEGATKVGGDDLGRSTTLESNKSPIKIMLK